MSKKIEKLTIKLWLLALTSSLLLSIPFLVPHTGFVVLFALIPLLAAEELARENKKRFFFISYFTFFMWNIISTYWVYFATPPGAAAAIILNSLQMAIIFTLFRRMRNITKGFLPYIFLMCTWLAWEHSYFTWDINWPWLVLGNSFATSIKSIQWYEFTGSLGGSFWALLVNTLLFRVIMLKIKKEKIIASAISVGVIIIFPIILSHIIYNSYKESENPRNFTVLQPNIDPFNDKFNGLTQIQQDNILIKLINESYTGKERLILAPETFISPDRNNRLFEDNAMQNTSFAKFNNMNNELIIGAVTEKMYYTSEEPTPTAREVGNNMWYDNFNSAIFINGAGEYEFYHKSKLVILAESNPFSKGPLKFISKLVSGIEGGIGNFGTQPYRTIFTASDSVKIGVAICYESIFGDYYREYVLKGANVMGIITNDGWWRDTPGHKHHLSYASLRAIETRRAIARSANTGISAFINQRGDILSQTKWWEEGYLNGTLNLNDEITIFVQYGDIIGRVSKFMFFMFLLLAISRKISKKYIIKESC